MGNFYLYFTAFVSGFVLMGFEIFGTRILEPYFGSGMHVWGALISVVMGGLSCGYAGGGVVADKKNPGKFLVLSLAIAGILMLVFPLVSTFVCVWIDFFKMGSKVSTLTAALILFFVPSFFIGMISPLLIKLKVKNVDSVGKGAGEIYSITTAGSIAGTLVTAFFLIGKFPSYSGAVALFGGVLLINSGIICFRHKKELYLATDKKKSLSSTG